MKLIFFITLFCITCTQPLFAQIYLSDNGLTTSGTGTSTKVSLGGSLTGNTTLNLGANNLIFNSTTGHLGIRTASPLAPLHVYKNISGNYNPIVFLEDGLTDGYVMLAFKGTGRQYHLGTGNASEPHFGVSNKFFIWDQNASSMRMVLDPNGNFGFGTVTPANRVSVNSATANTSGLQLMQLTNASPVVAGNNKVLSVDATGNVILVNASAAAGTWGTSGNTSGGTGFLGTTDAYPLIFKTNNTQQMELTAAGELKLGTVDPSLTAKLDVDGIVRFNSHFRVNNFAFTKGINIPDFVNLHQGIRLDNTDISSVHFQSSFHGSLEANWVFEGSLTDTRDFFENASIVRIHQGWGNPSFSNDKQVATLLIDPVIRNTSSRTYTARGIYYKPSLENINGVAHIAIENTYGQNRFNSLGGNTLIGTDVDNGDKLQVNGRVFATGFRMPTGALPGYVLTTDINGNATWQAGGGGGSGGNTWSTIGNTVASVQALGTINAFDLPIITNNQERMRITSGGNIGIGTNAPAARLHVNGASLLDGNLDLGPVFNTTNAYGKILNFNTGGSNLDALWIARYNRGSDQSELHMNIGDDGGGNDKLVIGYTNVSDGLWKAQYTFQADGKLGIGTNVPLTGNYRLFVEDGIRTRKVKVDPGTWPDYVFEENYSLMPLPVLEEFIRTHHHLPNIPSATEVKKEGLDLGSNQAMLLQKIEELSLYLIEQGKQLKEQQQKIAQLEKALEGKK